MRTEAAIGVLPRGRNRRIGIVGASDVCVHRIRHPIGALCDDGILGEYGQGWHQGFAPCVRV